MGTTSIAASGSKYSKVAMVGVWGFRGYEALDISTATIAAYKLAVQKDYESAILTGALAIFSAWALKNDLTKGIPSRSGMPNSLSDVTRGRTDSLDDFSRSRNPSAGGGNSNSNSSDWFAKTTETGSTLLPPGAGRTDRYGNITYSTLGSPEDVALALYHERVHSFLSPKFVLFREFRADLMEFGYKRSALLRGLEEALAESIAQMRVHGIRGLPTGIRFPVEKGYVTIRSLVVEGSIGTIVIGSVTYGVYVTTSKPNERD